VIDKTVLPNGVTVVSKKMPHVRSVSMGVWVNVGARDETEDQSGLSHFIEHMIFKGTARRTAYQIAKAFDAIGGQTNAFTSMEYTCYHARVLDAHVETMVEILSDIFLNSIFDPEEVDRERPVILQEIGMVEDSPEEYLHQVAGRDFWGNHPLGRSILGNRENIQKFSAQSIRAFFHRFYHPERIVIAVTGNVDHGAFVDLVGPAFGSIHNGHDLPERHRPDISPVARAYQRDIEQTHICLSTPGLPITDPQRFAFSLINTLMGGNMSSRLFQEIREQRGLAYSVYSFMAAHEDTGMFGIYAGVHPDNAEQTIDLAVDHLKRIAREPVSLEELQDAIEFTKGNLCLAAESVDNQMVRLAQNEIHFKRYIPISEVIQQVESVSPDDIRRLAAQLFKSERTALTVLGASADDMDLQRFLSF
jgi:predicted Zn-dependent peptidase